MGVFCVFFNFVFQSVIVLSCYCHFYASWARFVRIFFPVGLDNKYYLHCPALVRIVQCHTFTT